MGGRDRRHLATFVGALVAVASLAPLTTARASHEGQAATPITILMTDTLRFDPAEVTVLVGTRVTWRNAGDPSNNIPHTVTAYESTLPGGAAYFDSNGASGESAARAASPTLWLKPGESFNHTFTVPGDYRYFCVPHEGAGMKGVVHVVTELPGAGGEIPTGLLIIGGLITAGALTATAYLWRVRRRRV